MMIKGWSGRWILGGAVTVLLHGFMVFPVAGGPLPLPRFVSLRSDEVNLRVGPGSEYPVDWIYMRERLPVEVISEFGPWRKIRDNTGTVGWVHQSMVSGMRTAMNTFPDQILRKKPGTGNTPIAKVEAGAIGKLIQCRDGWCYLQFDKTKGWLMQRSLFGVYHEEIVK